MENTLGGVLKFEALVLVVSGSFVIIEHFQSLQDFYLG